MDTVTAALAAAVMQLQTASDTARLDAEILLQHVLQKDRVFLYTWPDHALTSMQQQQFSALLLRRAQGEPVAYIIGQREFWSLPLRVNTSTLVPRPETELLVELVLQLCPASIARVLDLGTGTGAIALALASEKPQWDVHAVDRAPDAVALALLNRAALGLQNVTCYQSDWFAAVLPRLFDVIVSNPPYLAENDTHLQQGDVRFEPRTALVAADGGLADIAAIIRAAPAYLAAGGHVLVEHGCNQGEQVRTLFAAAGYSHVHTHRDLAGHERVTTGTKHE